MPSSSSRQRLLAVAVLTAATLSVRAAPGQMEQLRQHFINPPDDARIMMRWWWFGSAVTKPELEREMKVMKAGGLGGFEVQPVYPLDLDDPETGFVNLPYLSDGYLDALKFAAEKSRELGLRMDVTLGSGWPFGGPRTPVTEAAGALRCDRIVVPANAASVPMPAIGNGEKFIAAFLARGDRKQFEGGSVQPLLKFEANRIELLPGLDGNHVVLAFISSRSGMQVKRPAVGAEGFVLDHYDLDAIQHHLNTVGTKLMQAFGSHPPIQFSVTAWKISARTGRRKCSLNFRSAAATTSHLTYPRWWVTSARRPDRSGATGAALSRNFRKNGTLLQSPSGRISTALSFAHRHTESPP